MKKEYQSMKKLSRFKLLEKDAIKKSMYLWKWLSENPHLQKQDYPNHERDIEPCYEECPCCDFYLEKSKSKTCKDCPVYNEGLNCYEFDSDYKKWLRSDLNLELHEEYATRIFLRLKKAYYKMGGRIRK